MWRRLLIALGTGIVIVGVWFVWLLNAVGQFKTLRPHFDGTCTAVTGVVGAEDISIHPRTGVAYLSACDRLGLIPAGERKGAIYAYDLTPPSPRSLHSTAPRTVSAVTTRPTVRPCSSPSITRAVGRRSRCTRSPPTACCTGQRCRIRCSSHPTTWWP